MYEEEVLKAMSNIDDKYIEEAAGAASEGGISASGDEGWRDVSVPKAQKAQGKKKSRRWVKWVGGLAAVLVVCVAVGGMFASGMFNMGSSGSARNESFQTAAAEPMAPMPAGGSKGAVNGWADAEAAMPAEAPMAPGYGGGSYYVSDNKTAGTGLAIDTSSLENANVKLIYTAYMSVQTTDIDETTASLEALVNECGGYFESTSVDNGGIYSDGIYRSAYYTVRIPTAKYETFINTAGEKWHITSLNQNVENIGQQYFETEMRLETLRTKEKRLHELLEQAGDLSDVIQLESALSDTEYQIDMYTSTLKRYDSLVDYSTVSVDVQQVKRVEQTIEQDESFGARLSRSFSNGTAHFVRSLQEFALWATYNLFTLIIWAVIIILVILIVRRIIRRRRKALK